VLIGDSAWSSALLRLGVRAILPPDSSATEIVAAVSAAAAGLAAIDPGCSSHQ
jgi:DNA-binding NarL/FixJ family response regulator